MANQQGKKNNKQQQGFKKITYKKKPKIKQELITTAKRQVLDPEFKKEVVKPTEKYAQTIKFLKSKRFFVDANTGQRIPYIAIKEFHATMKKADIPILVCNVKYKSKDGHTSEETKVFTIIRYNEQEIIGLNSKNVNIWHTPIVDVSSVK